jgi:hypothetical protein
MGITEYRNTGRMGEEQNKENYHENTKSRKHEKENITFFNDKCQMKS